jgi:hypothetical protein
MVEDFALGFSSRGRESILSLAIPLSQGLAR